MGRKVVKKVVITCDLCDDIIEDGDVLYECSKCKNVFCEGCVIEHLLEKNILKDVSDVIEK